jgi:hypothetical protein
VTPFASVAVNVEIGTVRDVAVDGVENAVITGAVVSEELGGGEVFESVVPQAYSVPIATHIPIINSTFLMMHSFVLRCQRPESLGSLTKYLHLLLHLDVYVIM